MKSDKRSATHSGKDAEDAALMYLQQHGLRLVSRNHRCRSGEIDLIMHDDGVLVFVEVRFRRSDRFGSALESVNWVKRRRIVAAANQYLASNRTDSPVRFDVVAMAPGSTDVSINWVKDAFQLGSP